MPDHVYDPDAKGLMQQRHHVSERSCLSDLKLYMCIRARKEGISFYVAFSSLAH